MTDDDKIRALHASFEMVICWLNNIILEASLTIHSPLHANIKTQYSSNRVM